MSYREKGSDVLGKVLWLEARIDGLASRLDALEATVSRLEVHAAVHPAVMTRGEDAPLEGRLAQNEQRDKHVSEKVGHLALRVSAIERELGVKARAAGSDDDLRALVDEELGQLDKRRR
jgi:hypothetical protein